VQNEVFSMKVLPVDQVEQPTFLFIREGNSFPDLKVPIDQKRFRGIKTPKCAKWGLSIEIQTRQPISTIDIAFHSGNGPLFEPQRPATVGSSMQLYQLSLSVLWLLLG
jgi:hypothetical protein